MTVVAMRKAIVAWLSPVRPLRVVCSGVGRAEACVLVSAACAWLGLGMLPGGARAADWPQWRGPSRTGTVDAVLPEELPAKLGVVWRVEVGEGHSSPVVVGDRVYSYARRGDDEVVTALALDDGHEVWSRTFATPYTVNPAAMAHGKGPKATPVVAGGSLCTLGISGTLRCFDRSDGAVRWSHDFAGRYDATSPDFGVAGSPLVVGDLLVVFVGGVERGSLAAFRLANGKEVWSWEGDAPAYASPIEVTLGGTRQIVTQSRDHILSVDAASGELLWSLPFETPFKQNIVTPALTGAGLLVFSGLEQGIFALRATHGEDGWHTEEVWRNDAEPLYMSSPVLDDGVVYGLTHKNRGQLFALDASTGETLWSSEARMGDNASLVVAGDRLLVLTSGADLLVAPTSRKDWSPQASYQVADSPTWAHLVVVDQGVLVSGVLVKDKTSLALLRF